MVERGLRAHSLRERAVFLDHTFFLTIGTRLNALLKRRIPSRLRRSL